MSVYVVSTLTNSVLYREYKFIGHDTRNGSGPLPVPKDGAVMIFGGANLPSETSGRGEMTRDFTGTPIWTTAGVVTTLTDEQYGRVKDHWLFKDNIEKGYYKVLNRDITGNEKEIRRLVEQDMTPHDGFAQMSKSNYKQRIKVKTPDKSLSQDPADHQEMYDKGDPLAEYRQ